MLANSVYFYFIELNGLQNILLLSLISDEIISRKYNRSGFYRERSRKIGTKGRLIFLVLFVKKKSLQNGRFARIF
jgi:hypothetical protein